MEELLDADPLYDFGNAEHFRKWLIGISDWHAEVTSLATPCGPSTAGACPA
jgi:hypothetical protein